VLASQVGSVPLDEAVAGGADDVGHLEGGRLHLFFFRRERLVWSGAGERGFGGDGTKTTRFYKADAATIK